MPRSRSGAANQSPIHERVHTCVGSTIHRLLWVLLAAFLAGIVRADPPTWKAGLAKSDITPATSMWLAGYGSRDRPSEGTLHRLWLKVLVLEAPDGRRGVVVTSDLLGFPRAMYERIVAELGRCGLERSQIMLTASHTHTGPVLRDALYDIYPLDAAQRAVIEDYSAKLETDGRRNRQASAGVAAAGDLAGGRGRRLRSP